MRARDPALPTRSVSTSRCAFVGRDGLLCRRRPSGDRLCAPALGRCGCCTSSTRRRRAGTSVATRRSAWGAARCGLGLPATVEERVRTCQRVKADRLPPAGLLFPLPVPCDAAGVPAWTSSSCPLPAPAAPFWQVSAGAHRHPDRARVAGPYLQDRRRRDDGAQLGRAGVPRRKAARRALLGNTRFASANRTGLHAALLYWWPDDNWQRGTVAGLRVCQRDAFSHVVAYTQQTSALGTGTRCSTLPIEYFSRRRRPPVRAWPGPFQVLPAPRPAPSLSLVGGLSQLAARSEPTDIRIECSPDGCLCGTFYTIVR